MRKTMTVVLELSQRLSMVVDNLGCGRRGISVDPAAVR